MENCKKCWERIKIRKFKKKNWKEIDFFLSKNLKTWRYFSPWKKKNVCLSFAIWEDLSQSTTFETYDEFVTNVTSSSSSSRRTSSVFNWIAKITQKCIDTKSNKMVFLRSSKHWLNWVAKTVWIPKRNKTNFSFLSDVRPLVREWIICVQGRHRRQGVGSKE